MNKSILIAAVFLLTGCPGPMDPVPQEYPAQARLIDNQVCITVPVRAGDKIFSVQFGTESGVRYTKPLVSLISSSRLFRVNACPRLILSSDRVTGMRLIIS